VPTNPVQQSPFKANVIPEALGLQPLVAENFFPLREELLVE
jgi:hypothetical protein